MKEIAKIVAIGALRCVECGDVRTSGAACGEITLELLERGLELRAGGAGRVAAIKAELRRGRRDGRQCDNAAPQKAVDLSADPPLTSAPMIKILILVVGRRVGKAV